MQRLNRITTLRLFDVLDALNIDSCDYIKVFPNTSLARIYAHNHKLYIYVKNSGTIYINDENSDNEIFAFDTVEDVVNHIKRY